MLRFSADVRKAHPDDDRFDRIEEIYRTLVSLRIPEVCAADLSPVAKLPHKTSVLFQVGLRRGIEQIESCIREVNAGSLAPLYVAALGLFETVAVIAELWELIKHSVETWDGAQIKDLDERHMKALFGSRTPGWGDPEKVPAVSILTVIGRLSKALELERNLEEPYGGLSEHAHPNFAGMLGSYQRLDAANFRAVLIDRPMRDNPSALGFPLATIVASAALLKRAISGYRDVTYDFIRLCEEEIYKAGTWPANISYPLHPPH